MQTASAQCLLLDCMPSFWSCCDLEAGPEWLHHNILKLEPPEKDSVGHSVPENTMKVRTMRIKESSPMDRFLPIWRL